jgi:hypothetical protein
MNVVPRNIIAIDKSLAAITVPKPLGHRGEERSERGMAKE